MAADGWVASNAAEEGEVSAEVYLGVVKSYNDRRGFGFLACAETAARYGRDVYMPKAEATQAAAEAAAAGLGGEEARVAAVAAAEAAAAAAAAAAAGIAPTDKANTEKPQPAPRLAEEDLVLFRVRLSVEGYPQAACVKKLRKLSGVVARLPAEERPAGIAKGGDGTCDAQGAARNGAGVSPLGAITSEGAEKTFGMREVLYQRTACGQVRMALGDEVTFCVPVAAEAQCPDGRASNGAGPDDAPEAKMVVLAKTGRSPGSVLGCFTLDLPRTGGGEDAPPKPNLSLDCHAFGDKLILAGLPQDLEEPELMRFFSKQAATQTIVARARTCSFASVSFPSAVEVARFLGRVAHAFADDKETRIARLLPLAADPDTARLPALPAPTLAASEEAGSLLVVWSPLVLAVAYAVEMRPVGCGGLWVTVDVASNRLGNSGNRFDSSCSSCKVAGLDPTTAYEARVAYFTECGTRSEASEASDGCIPGPTSQALNLDGDASLGATEGFGGPMGQPGYGLPPDLGEYGPAGAMPQGMPPAPPAWPAWLGPEGLPAGVGPLHDGFAPPYIPSPIWRSPTGMVVPPPAAPEVRPADEHGFAVSIQWPAVLQASAYVVELREAGSTAFERFVRAAPEARMGSVVELRVGGLRPGSTPGRVYVAQVRVVGADGSESAPSPPGWSTPLPAAPEATGSPGGTMPHPASASASTAPAVATPSPTGPAGGSVLSADAPEWQPGAAVPAADGPAGAPLSVPTAAALMALPPSQPAPCLGAPAGAPAAAAPPGYAPGGSAEVGVSGAALGHAGAQSAGVAPWGAPGVPGVPPPPAGPPSLGKPGLPQEDLPPEVTGHEECLILD